MDLFLLKLPQLMLEENECKQKERKWVAVNDYNQSITASHSQWEDFHDMILWPPPFQPCSDCSSFIGGGGEDLLPSDLDV